VVAAARVGLDGLAITDHDTISALGVARDEARHWGVELINGVELTCEHRARELHILGYYFREEDPGLAAALDRLRDGRAGRIEAMATRLGELGLQVDLDALRRAFPRAAIGRRHLAEYLARSGQVSGPREAFGRFLGDGGPACIAKTGLDAEEAIGLIGRAGGVAGLAHPPHDFGESAIRVLADAGLAAIEVDGPSRSRGLGRRLAAIADRLGLVGIAGSDFHAADRPGRWIGSITTRLEVLQRLRDAAGAANGARSPRAGVDTGPTSRDGSPIDG
jgi:predicted metal-dependent phosphoesterase TrpH